MFFNPMAYTPSFIYFFIIHFFFFKNQLQAYNVIIKHEKQKYTGEAVINTLKTQTQFARWKKIITTSANFRNLSGF